MKLDPMGLYRGNRGLTGVPGLARAQSAPDPGAPGLTEGAAEAAKESAFKDKLEAAAAKKDLKALREASQEFEAYFVGVLLKQMRKTVIDSGLIEKSEARKQFESMLDDEYAKRLAKSEGFGIAKSLFEAMRKAYE